MIQNPNDIRFDRVIEECAELIKAISKARRFGMFDHHPTKHQSNCENIIQECADILVVIDQLEIPEEVMEVAKQIKKQKLTLIKQREVVEENE